MSDLLSYIISDLTFQLPFTESFLQNALLNGLIYFILAGLFYSLLWSPFQLKPNSRIQLKVTSTFTKRVIELLHSLSAVFIFALVDILLIKAGKAGYTKVYFEHTTLLSFLTSVTLMILLHDTYFYWSHRLLHNPRFYWIHKIHHKSTDPSPFAAFAFHPIETLIEAFFYVLFVVFIPVHVDGIITWQVLQQVDNCILHSGYEIYPSSFLENFVFRFKTSSTVRRRWSESRSTSGVSVAT
ncbi:hypothetical protein TL16_g02394 [Triparma laevis f. inornata]|uniref:Fatty acid hydroxylase domain-containing protein n=1 Tax=Triparma laevis f. inornata TaxID=1714386 RepID=A0A9W6ZN92_9STRA|nr:hypothetical protein TL16_g02394 [Triparma laevis f. inornata]